MKSKIFILRRLHFFRESINNEGTEISKTSRIASPRSGTRMSTQIQKSEKKWENCRLNTFRPY